MFRAIVTNAIISKGFDGADALRFSTSENSSSVQFKFGHRVYDSRAEGNHRYINMAAKAFGPVCERIKKMKLKEGSYVNLEGRIDEEKWEEDSQKRSRIVIIIDEIEFASNGNGKDNSNGNSNGIDNGKTGNSIKPATQNCQGTVAQNPQQPSPPQQKQQGSQPPQTGTPPGFGGFESFGNGNPFFPTGG